MDYIKAVVNSFFEAEYNKKKILKEIKLKYNEKRRKCIFNSI